MTNLIGISGKIGSGKDTVGKIIQYLTSGYDISNKTFDEFNHINTRRNDYPLYLDWQIKKFADKLKQIVSILTGIPIEDLEKEEVKNRILGEEWTKYYYISINGHKSIYYNTYDEALKYCPKSFNMIEKEELTVRKLLQQIGTDAMRNVIHPNIWVNALMSGYTPKICSGVVHCALASKYNISCWNCPEYPNWIITDVRFPNETKAIKDRCGIIIRINREDITGQNKLNTHTSETALDDYQFDYIIDNFGTLKELIDKVEEILIKEGIL